MNGPTPDQQRKIEKAYISANKYWYVDTSTKELRRKQLEGWRGIWDFIWPQKHTMWEIYWWVKQCALKNNKILAIGFPLKSDNTPIKGVPTKYELQDGWTIPCDDLKFLIKGPLVSENNLADILVQVDQPWERWKIYLQRFGIVSPVIVAIGAAYRWRAELTELLQRIVN